METSQFFSSRDVIFHESIFPFASKSTEVIQSGFPTSSIDYDDIFVDLSSQHIDGSKNTSVLVCGNADSIPISSSNSQIVSQPKRSNRVSKKPSYLGDFLCPTLNNVSTGSRYPIQNFLSWHRLSPTYNVFAANIIKATEPQFYYQVGRSHGKRNQCIRN